MEYLEYIVHFDKYLTEIIEYYNVWAYLVLAIIVFFETGLFMAPFLPEESLLFVIGTISASGAMDIRLITIILILSNLIGETVNFYIGVCFGPKIFKSNSSILFNEKHILKALEFYERHGGKTIIIAKYIPLIRTFIPFVAGMIKVRYRDFIWYNMIGGIPWICLFILGGYFFGNISIVSENFVFVIIFIIIISISPGIITFIRNKVLKKTATNYKKIYENRNNISKDN